MVDEQEKIKLLENEIEEKIREIEAVRSEILQTEELEENLRQSREENVQLNNKIIESSTEYSILQNENKLFINKIEALEYKNDDLEDKIEELKQKLEDLKDIEDEEENLREQLSEFNDNEQKLKERIAELNQTNYEFIEAKKEITETKKEISDLKTKIALKNTRMQELVRELKGLALDVELLGGSDQERSNELTEEEKLNAEDKKGSNTRRVFYFLGKIIRHPVLFFRMAFNRNWAENTVVFLVMQTLDNKMKFILKKWPFQKKLTLSNNHNLKVQSYIPIGQEIMHRFAKKANAHPQNSTLEILFNVPSTAHILGGSPMGTGIENGVVNSNFKVHNYPNMYILDGSVVQGNLGVNPSFTITALAEYAMSKIPGAGVS